MDTALTAAGECTALRHAHLIAEWVGQGRKVTAKGVLRRADVPEAARILGIEVPSRVRTAADVPDLHRPWQTALAIGRVSIRNGRTVAGSESTPEMPEAWFRGLVACLSHTFGDATEAEALKLAKFALTELTTTSRTGEKLLDLILHTAIETDFELFRRLDQGFGHRHPVAVLLDELAGFGAVAANKHAITPLGRWALEQIAEHGTAVLGEPEATAGPGEVCQLKITLRYVKPPCWRRVQVPATSTLDELHAIIQIALDWDGDHLHTFTVGRRSYGDPFFDVGDDEAGITVAEAFAGRRKIEYVYDLGDEWRHEIILEKTVDIDPEVSYPTCTSGRGDSPVEDWCEDDPRKDTPFDQAAINDRFAKLTGVHRDLTLALYNDVEIIMQDAYGAEEAATAFLTVLNEEIDFPVPATVLGHPLIVTGLDLDEITLGLRAECRANGQDGSLAFVGLKFRDGTVETWLQAVYLAAVGDSPSDATRPEGWHGLARWVT
jgi:hypothetical protein